MKLVRKDHKERKKVSPRKARENYLAKVEGELESVGVKFFEDTGDSLGGLEVDKDFLSLPSDITEVPSRDLGSYLNAFTQQKMFLRTLYGRAEILLEFARREYYTVSSPVYSSFNSRMSETAKDRLVNYHEDVLPYYEEYMDKKRQCSLIQYSIENIEDAIFLISREISRRGGDFNDETRAHNVGRR